MQPLSEVLKNTALKPQEDSKKQSTQQLGSTNADGRTNIALSFPRRERALTENQVTEIASRTLRAPFKLNSISKPKYGRMIDGYWEPNALSGEFETCMEISIDFVDNCPIPMLKAALALSPPQACLKHVTHLVLHKKVGSSDQDRAILISDYVTALANVPEFIFAEVCRHYRENDRRPFMPFIAEFKDSCRLLQEAFERELNPPARLAPREAPKPLKRADLHWKDLDARHWLPSHWDEYIADAAGMVELYKKMGKDQDAEAWRQILQTREGKRRESEIKT